MLQVELEASGEGLEQEFNSAFINSQRHEGWVCLPKAYDDGGFSGATMDRPALRQLLADIAAGRVDTVVVYKIDRLTRSLADFAKIVEILDARGTSFVSVTQQFNTTTSMGRLRHHKQVADERFGSRHRRQTILARCALPDIEEPDLSRRDHPQGAVPSRRTPANCRSGGVGGGSGTARRKRCRAPFEPAISPAEPTRR